jgi:hypothetical protein
VTRNIRCYKLENRNDNFLFWLKVWLSRNQFEPVCSSSDENPSKLPCTETGIAQLSIQVHSSPRRHMKDNGQGYLFCKTTFIDLNLVKAVEAVEDGQKSPFFKYLSIIFFFVKTKFFERFF